MPRSGTSLMMRMLDAGGLPALTDGHRAADAHNPHGYFEDERIRGLARDSSWLTEAQGRAVKIIYRLLPYLPPALQYRVVFMERDINEVYDSQQAMLQARMDPAAAQDRAIVRALARELESSKQWLAAQPYMTVLEVPYAGLIENPATWAANVARFLDGGLDEAAMAAPVDPSLYRHRGLP
jgi:hypothetical protein